MGQSLLQNGLFQRGKVTRIVDNPLANNQGLGVVCEYDADGNLLWGCGYFAARTLNNPSYSAFYNLLKDQPIYTLDSAVLFLPQADL